MADAEVVLPGGAITDDAGAGADLVSLGSASPFVIAANSFAYDAARYGAGQAATVTGYQAGTADVGREWVGLHGRWCQNPRSAPAAVAGPQAPWAR